MSLARPEPASTSSLALPRLLHLTWLGSPLPGDRFSANIASYAVLNPVIITYISVTYIEC